MDKRYPHSLGECADLCDTLFCPTCGLAGQCDLGCGFCSVATTASSGSPLEDISVAGLAALATVLVAAVPLVVVFVCGVRKDGLSAAEAGGDQEGASGEAEDLALGIVVFSGEDNASDSSLAHTSRGRGRGLSKCGLVMVSEEEGGDAPLAETGFGLATLCEDDEDDVTAPELARGFACGTPGERGLKLRILEDAGHIVHWW